MKNIFKFYTFFGLALLLAVIVGVSKIMSIYAVTFENAITAYEVRDYSKAYDIFEELSKKYGDSEAELNIAFMHYIGQDVVKDYKKSLLWFEKSAAKGNAEAQFYIALMYLRGRGVDRNYNEALLWYRKSTDQKYSEFDSTLIKKLEAYEFTPKLERDYRVKGELLRMAAENGTGREKYRLAKYLIESTSTFEEAFSWYQQAAEQGVAEAQYLLAARYQDGYIIEDNGKQILKSDVNQAIELFLKAAEQGHIESQVRLAELYLDGDQVKADYVTGYKWLILASPWSNDAKNNLNLYSNKISNLDIEKAKDLARDWAKNFNGTRIINNEENTFSKDNENVDIYLSRTEKSFVGFLIGVFGFIVLYFYDGFKISLIKYLESEKSTFKKIIRLTAMVIAISGFSIQLFFSIDYFL